jgi:hypothetical protein
MAYLTVRKRDDFESIVVSCMFSMACLWSRAIVRRRTATILGLSLSYSLEQASKDRTRRGAQKSANVVETGRFFPLGTIISIVLLQS